jgi:putative YphP/YqiW family bacilliredoxin
MALNANTGAAMHRYPDMMVAPMRRQITDLGAEELRTAEAVDAFLADAGGGTAMIVVNSVCGCSAGTMRPGLARALEQAPRPDRMATVFAGADVEATQRAREHFRPYPPSSPAIALFRGGELVFMLERHQIQGRQPDVIARDLAAALAAAAGRHGTAEYGAGRPDEGPATG